MASKSKKSLTFRVYSVQVQVVDIAINRNITVVKNPPHNMSTNQNKKRAREDVDDDDEREDIDDAMDEEDAVNLSNGHQNPD